MILDSFSNKGYMTARRTFEKAAIRNRYATVAAMLCVAYDSFHKMQLNRICAQNNCSYQEAERRSTEFSDAFGVDIPTEAFLPNEEQYSNMAIQCYKDYIANRSLLTKIGFSVGDVDAFCNMVFFNPDKYDLCHFRAFNSVGYAVVMVAVYDYLCGAISEEQLRMAMQLYEPSGMRPMNEKGVRTFVRTMYKIVYVFDEVIEIRKNRNEKKCC